MCQSCQDTDVVVLLSFTLFFKGTYLLLLLIRREVTPKVFFVFLNESFWLAH
jgi:hypothetical protein